MAQIKNIVEEEEMRNKNGVIPEIHLYQEGEFLRAYEWSAWLSCLLLHDLKTTHKQFKGIGHGVAFVGFPMTSLQKWLPQDCQMENVDDRHFRIVFEKTKLPDDAAEKYSAWKGAIPISEVPKSSKSETQRIIDAGPISITGIMRKIMEYQIESRSPIDCMMFLSQIKGELSKIV